jgi:uncharacterized membrane protein
MRKVLHVVSFLALAATITAPFLFLLTRLSLEQSKAIMLTAAIIWFAATPLWMGRPKVEEKVAI